MPGTKEARAFLFKELIRIHLSFAVNIDAINSFNEHDVLIDKHELPIGRNYMDEFLKQFDFNKAVKRHQSINAP